MQIEKLKGIHQGKDIYILGTGPSVRLFKMHYLVDKITIGLNQAYKHYQTNYSLTVHPELVLEYEEARKSNDPPNSTQWIVKQKAPMKHLKVTDPKYYVFHGTENLHVLVEPVPDYLYQGRGIQCTALHLAAWMGARSIVLVGVDMNALGGDHHAHEQHVRFHGLEPTDVYAEYRRWTSRVRDVLWECFSIPVMSLSPLLGEDAGSEEYQRLCTARGLTAFPEPPDTSAYQREHTDP